MTGAVIEIQAIPPQWFTRQIIEILTTRSMFKSCCCQIQMSDQHQCIRPFFFLCQSPQCDCSGDVSCSLHVMTATVH